MNLKRWGFSLTTLLLMCFHQPALCRDAVVYRPQTFVVDNSLAITESLTFSR